MPYRRSTTLALLGLGLALAACREQEGPLDYVVHQSVPVGGQAKERLEVLEDGRLTAAMRDAMWGGSKEPADFLAAPGVTASEALAKSFQDRPVRRAILRLIDGNGKALAERVLDCELAGLSDHPLPQGEGHVWALGNDCSTGEGNYAGLITRFFTLADGAFQWQGYRDPGSGKPIELTLVEARRIAWALVPPERVETVLEVSSHPDFDDARAGGAAPGAGLPPDLPIVVDYIRYRYDGAGSWTRRVRTARPASWDERLGFPPASAFPD